LEAALTSEKYRSQKKFKKTDFTEPGRYTNPRSTANSSAPIKNCGNWIDSTIEVQESFVKFPFSKIVGVMNSK